VKRTDWKRPISLSLSKEVLAYLKEKAKDEGRSRSEVVERLVTYSMNKEG
jgi:metal-responsive CopG/Arc/MetJ family transcriptional regulator